jgi:hypothetical protein
MGESRSPIFRASAREHMIAGFNFPTGPLNVMDLRVEIWPLGNHGYAIGEERRLLEVLTYRIDNTNHCVVDT